MEPEQRTTPPGKGGDAQTITVGTVTDPKATAFHFLDAMFGHVPDEHGFYLTTGKRIASVHNATTIAAAAESATAWERDNAYFSSAVYTMDWLRHRKRQQKRGTND